MKKTFLKILKLFAIFVVFLHFGCSKDFYDEPLSEGQVKISKVSISDPTVFNNYKLMQEIQKIKQKQEDLSFTNRIILDTIDGLYFDDEKGLLIEKDNGYKSFTFPIYRDVPSEKLENIVFSLKADNEYEPYLSKYTLSEQQIQMLNDGKIPEISPYEMEIISLSSSATAKCGWNLEQHLNVAGNYMIMTWTYTDCGGSSGSSGTGGVSGGLGTGTGSSGGGEGGSFSNGSGGGILTSPVGTNPHGGAGGGPSANLPSPCQQLNDNNSKPIANTNPPKTVLSNLNDLTSQMATNPRERMYVLSPDTVAENQFVENYAEGPLNGGDAELTISNLVVSILMHCHYDLSLLSIFSLSDIYQMYAIQSAGYMLNEGQTFTSYLVTAHGTKYAIKFAPPARDFQMPFSESFFIGWEADIIKKAREDKYEESVKQTNTPAQNELGFLQFIKDQNLGIELYKADASFSQWSKLTLNSGGRAVVPVPCP